MRKKLLSNSLWISLTKITTFVFSFGGSILLARLLDPEIFGIVAMATAVSAVGTKFALIGIRPEVIRLDEEDDEYVSKLSTIFWLNIIITALGSGLLILIVESFGLLSAPASYIFSTIVCGWALDNCMLPARAVLHKNQRYKSIFFLRVFVPLVSLPIAVLMAFSGLGVWSLVLPQAAALALSGWIAFVLAGMPIAFVFLRSTAISIASKGRWYLTHSVMSGGYSDADKLLIGYFLGTTTLGLYHRSYSISKLFQQQLGTMLYTLGLPIFSGVRTSEDVKIKFLKYGVKFISYIVCPAVVTFSVFSTEIITFVYGEKWVTSAEFFDYLVPFSVLWSIYQLLKGKLVGSGDIKFIAKVDIAKLIIMLSASVFLVASFGVLGIAVGLALGALIANILLIKKILADDLSKFLKAMVYPLTYLASVILLGLVLEGYVAVSVILALSLCFMWLERADIAYVIKGKSVNQ